MKRGTMFVAAALFLASVTPAAALDGTTGTYEGKIKCARLIGGATDKFTGEMLVALSEDEKGSVTMSITAGSGLSTETLGGFVVESSSKADRGKIVAVECPLSFSSNVGATVHMDVVVKPGGEKATLKGTMIDMIEPNGVASLCTFTAKRAATKPPILEACTQ